MSGAPPPLAAGRVEDDVAPAAYGRACGERERSSVSVVVPVVPRRGRVSGVGGLSLWCCGAYSVGWVPAASAAARVGLFSSIQWQMVAHSWCSVGRLMGVGMGCVFQWSQRLQMTQA